MSESFNIDEPIPGPNGVCGVISNTFQAPSYGIPARFCRVLQSADWAELRTLFHVVELSGKGLEAPNRVSLWET